MVKLFTFNYLFSATHTSSIHCLSPPQNDTFTHSSVSKNSSHTTSSNS